MENLEKLTESLLEKGREGNPQHDMPWHLALGAYGYRSKYGRMNYGVEVILSVDNEEM